MRLSCIEAGLGLEYSARPYGNVESWLSMAYTRPICTCYIKAVLTVLLAWIRSDRKAKIPTFLGENAATSFLPVLITLQKLPYFT